VFDRGGKGEAKEREGGKKLTNENKIQVEEGLNKKTEGDAPGGLRREGAMGDQKRDKDRKKKRERRKSGFRLKSQGLYLVRRDRSARVTKR